MIDENRIHRVNYEFELNFRLDIPVHFIAVNDKILRQFFFSCATESLTPQKSYINLRLWLCPINMNEECGIKNIYGKHTHITTTLSSVGYSSILYYAYFSSYYRQIFFFIWNKTRTSCLKIFISHILHKYLALALPLSRESTLRVSIGDHAKRWKCFKRLKRIWRAKKKLIHTLSGIHVR